MEHVLETAVFDEITFAKNEAVLDVINALVVEYDKMDYIMSHTDCSDEFSIVQESFTKPKKDEKPEEASKENNEEAKEEKSTEKESPEEKKDNNKKEEKESDD